MKPGMHIQILWNAEPVSIWQMLRTWESTRHRYDVEIERWRNQTPCMYETKRDGGREGGRRTGDPFPSLRHCHSTKEKGCDSTVSGWVSKRREAEFTVFNIPPAPEGNIPGPLQRMIYHRTWLPDLSKYGNQGWGRWTHSGGFLMNNASPACTNTKT